MSPLRSTRTRLYGMATFLVVCACLPAYSFTGLSVGDTQRVSARSSRHPVELYSTNAVSALQIEVLYDPSKFRHISPSIVTQPGDAQIRSLEIEPGRVRVVAHRRTSGAFVNGPLFHIPLTLQSGTSPAEPVVLANVLASDANGNGISSVIQPNLRLSGLKSKDSVNGRFGIELSLESPPGGFPFERVAYFLGGVLLGETQNSTFSFNWQPELRGPAEILIVGYNENGDEVGNRLVQLEVTHVGTYDGTVRGTYYGLVRGALFSFPNDGYVTMTSTTRGRFTLKLFTGGRTLSAVGQFDDEGNAVLSLDRRNAQPLSVVLAHSSTPPVDQIHGQIADGTFSGGKFSGHTFKTEFTVDRVVWTKRRLPSQIGNYTVLLPPSEDAAAELSPVGTSFGRTTVSKNGSVKIAASLADGTTFTASTFVSKDGRWPLYRSLYRKAGLAMGVLDFAWLPGLMDLHGSVLWYRPSDLKAKAFNEGFTTVTEAVGSRYTKPQKGVHILSLANLGGNALLEHFDGGLSEPFQRIVTLNSAHKAYVPLQEADQTKLTILPRTGLFKGSFLHPATQKKTAFVGALLQEQNLGSGYFLSGEHSGRMHFAGNNALPSPNVVAGPIGLGRLPVLRITHPKNGSSVRSFAENAVQIKGIATDRQGIAGVQIQVFHDGFLTQPLNAAGTTQWTYDLRVPEGVGGLYTIFAKATDINGDQSEVIASRFWVPIKGDLSVVENGPGKVSRGFAGITQRDLDKLITIKATPDPKKKFLGWTGDVNSTSPKVTIMMRPNMTLVANFGE